MNLERFTQKSADAIMSAQNLALENNNQEIDTIHLLKALISQDDGIIPKILQLMNININSIDNDITDSIKKLPKISGDNISNVYASRKFSELLSNAEKEMLEFKDEYVSVEHIFLAMFKEKNSLVSDIFKKYDIKKSTFLEKLLNVRGNQKVTGQNPEDTYNVLEKYGRNLVEMAKKVTTDKRKGVGIALNSGSAQWAFTGFALQNSSDGKNLMSEDGKKVFFNTPENIEALQFWIDLQKKDKVMAEGIVQWTDLPAQFLAGEVAMIYHTTGNLSNIAKNAKFNYGVAFLPGHKRKGAPTGGGNFYISSGISKEKQKAAWKFIKYLTTAERAAQWSIDTGYVPTRKSAFETEIMKKYYAERPQAKVAYEQLKFAKPELTTYNAAEIWRILNDNIQSAITGEKSAKDALDNAQKEATEVLKDFN